MSHFSVLVITPEYPTETVLEAILMPYHEYECTGIEQYLEFVPADMEELQKEYTEYGKGETFETFMEGWSNDKQNDQGVWGRMTNPNAKWDWWTVGGRYSNRLIDGRRAPGDTLMKSACDWGAMAYQRRINRIASWNEATNDRGFTDNRKQIEFIYGIPVDADRDTFVETDPGFQCFALLNSHGWHEKSKMHWFAMHDENPDWPAEFRRLLDAVPDHYFLTVVDCHI